MALFLYFILYWFSWKAKLPSPHSLSPFPFQVHFYHSNYFYLTPLVISNLCTWWSLVSLPPTQPQSFSLYITHASVFFSLTSFIPFPKSWLFYGSLAISSAHSSTVYLLNIENMKGSIFSFPSWWSFVPHEVNFNMKAQT